MPTKIAKATSSPFQLRLKSRIKVGREIQTTRWGHMLFLEDEQGHLGCGEISPLPGMHHDAGNTNWQFSLLSLLPSLVDMPLGKNVAESRVELNKMIKGMSVSPSLPFGVEMALANLWAAREGLPWSRVENPNSPLETPVQGLLWGKRDQIFEQLEAQVHEGYKTFKWKVARQDVLTEREILTEIISALPKDTHLRMDANARWSLEDACAFVHNMDLSQVDFIEEPLAQVELLPTFVERTGCPVALDESLHQWEHPKPPPRAEDEALYPHLFCATALVIKPQVIGGWSVTNAWHQWANARGRQTVWSSAFESGIGLAYLAQWSAAAAPGTVAGLDTQKWFRDQLVPTLAHSGTINLVDAQAHTNEYTSQTRQPRGD